PRGDPSLNLDRRVAAVARPLWRIGPTANGQSSRGLSAWRGGWTTVGNWFVRRPRQTVCVLQRHGRFKRCCLFWCDFQRLDATSRDQHQLATASVHFVGLDASTSSKQALEK